MLAAGTVARPCRRVLLTGFLVAALCAAAEGAGAGGAAAGEKESTDHSRHLAAMASRSEEVTLGAMSIPDVVLQTQDGEDVHFYSDLVKDRVVAMNFVFTTCTTICPPMGANFASLQQHLVEQERADVHLISVSVDPAVDTPQRLKAWAEKFGARPGWTLVTGRKPDVDDLLKALKVFTPDKEDHSPIVLVGNDRRDEWTRVWGLAPPTELAAAIDRVISTGHGAMHDRGGNPE